jgi:hypothetical protein
MSWKWLLWDHLDRGNRMLLWLVVMPVISAILVLSVIVVVLAL